ncbi:MAG TPA: hypothetical protein VGZ22_08590 [Isosphaeraceae bacterium]|jgi:hypothetical protein|nr:hypothetical protein [Isosphaeraceae bacterium]
MSKHLRVGLLVTLGFFCGWIMGQIGPWRVYAQNPVPVERYTYNNITGWEIAVRTVGETNITKDTKRIGVELYRDNYNGNLLYVTEAGSIAVVPERILAPAPAAPPAPQ